MVLDVEKLSDALHNAKHPPPWIRPWESAWVHAWGQDDILSDQSNLDLAVAAVNALPELLELTRMREVERLARALHEFRRNTSFAGCGWLFGSVIDGDPLCPCPSDALEIWRLM